MKLNIELESNIIDVCSNRTGQLITTTCCKIMSWDLRKSDKPIHKIIEEFT
jgi:hypothetical protein